MADDAVSFMPSTESERVLNRLWRAWRTVHELCRDRGYELTDEEVEISYEDFKAQYSDSGLEARGRMIFTANPTQAMLDKHTPMATASKPDPQPDAGTIYIEFAKELSIGIKQMRSFAQTLSSRNYHTGVLITQSALSGPALKIIPAALPIRIETFREQDLLVNITKHVLVPKHVLLSSAEKKALLERYRLKETQLPRIQVGDPVAKYLGLKRGDVVKIIRKSETAGRYASYRWTV